VIGGEDLGNTLGPTRHTHDSKRRRNETHHDVKRLERKGIAKNTRDANNSLSRWTFNCEKETACRGPSFSSFVVTSALWRRIMRKKFVLKFGGNSYFWVDVIRICYCNYNLLLSGIESATILWLTVTWPFSFDCETRVGSSTLLFCGWEKKKQVRPSNMNDTHCWRWLCRTVASNW